MKKIKETITGRLQKMTAILSVITCMFLFASMTFTSWGANKQVVKMGGSFALIGLVAKMKKQGIEVSEDEEKSYNALDAHIKEYTEGLLTADSFKANFEEAWSKLDSTSKDKFIKESGAVKEMEEALFKQGNAIDQLKTLGFPSAGGNAKSLKDQIKDALNTVENKEILEKMKLKQNPNANFSFQVKAIGGGNETVASSTAYTTAATQIAFPQPDFIPGLNDVARNQPFLIQLLNVMNTTKENIVFTEKYAPTGSASWVAEGDAAPQVAFDIKIGNSRAKMIDAFIKVSTQMLDDVDYMAAEISKELIYQVAIATDTYLFQGDGVGANLAGIKSFAPAYTLTSLSTTTPNNCDAVLACAAQVAHNNFIPDTAVMNPLDVANTKLLKGTTGYYIINPNNDKDTWAGIRVVASNQVPLGTIMVMDSSKTNVYKYEDFTLSYGWINDDFQKHYVSIMGQQRLHFFIKNNDTNGFVLDTLTNVLTALTAV